MITIEVNKKERNSGEFVKPKNVFGVPHGEVYQQYSSGLPQRCFLIGTGIYDRPVEIWWNTESRTYRLSSSSKKELKELNSHIKYKKVECDITLTLDIY